MEEERQILEWLSSLAPREWQKGASVGRADGVGGWLLQMDKFEKWHTSEDQAVYSGMEARGGEDISEVCKYESGEISSGTRCLGTSAFVRDSMYDLIGGQCGRRLYVQYVTSMLIKCNLLLVC